MLSGARQWFVIAALVLLLDQASKIAVVNSLHYGQVIPLLPFFNLVLVHNTGAAFSFLADAGGWQRYFFSGLGIVVSIVISRMLLRHWQEKRLCWSLALILGGALGNVIDRSLYGYVIDFLDFYLGAHHWPAFNLADTAIVLGAALMVLDSFIKPPVKAGAETRP
ncbi:signal peptidase II [Chitinimonas lacunae]|uniref:Lipoprotein signal peptidase n=1 Tax=Chitinimonas lacunae TaxID=1963018 RepID=A0ABV8MLS9_9NEIS